MCVFEFDDLLDPALEIPIDSILFADKTITEYLFNLPSDEEQSQIFNTHLQTPGQFKLVSLLSNVRLPMH